MSINKISLTLAIGCLTLAGCSPSGPPMGFVSGSLTMSGQPIENGSIEFVPLSGGRPSLALSNSDGEYEAYYLPGVAGVIPGKYKIRFEIGKSSPSDAGIDRPKRGRRPTGKLVLEPSEIEVLADTNEIHFQLVEQNS
ncbi:hypothetical protein K227x_50680 [Rubripirellula lacrimiformis]|uniref:Carboxypeptidase regulatory-like domain-containing protein n=1 Tax=Rubripirellula lacrimiformis TaxID=1930273 RepID=A0A517NHP3_9BACT|nr:carboxypeptidase-like regulatory domain-containing protein [Rubripirellula lacrimiformis]QDT06652.1 hypothetical protein K227x_50680 [Rubripirellula lacrimiformis]